MCIAPIVKGAARGICAHNPKTVIPSPEIGYFDDPTPNQLNGTWTNATNGFDGNVGTYTQCTSAALVRLDGDGVRNGISYGAPIVSVEFRVYMYVIYTGGSGILNLTATALDGTTTLGSRTVSAVSANVPGGGTWTGWTTLAEPAGGWSQAFIEGTNFKIRLSATQVTQAGQQYRLHSAEIRVNYS